MQKGWFSEGLAQQGRKTQLSLASVCPCGSGWVIASCCFDSSDRKLRKKIPSIEPPGPQTHFAHAGCYLRDTNNCSSDISREHYLSANVLEQIAASEKAVKLSGAPFLAEGESKALPLKALTAKILCQRHNTALSPLDQEAGRFFDMLTSAMMRKATGPGSTKKNLWLASGTAVELWMLKVACGFYFSGVGTSNRNSIRDTHSIDMRKVLNAFSGKWEERAGLYFNGHVGTNLTTAFHVQVQTLSDDVNLGGIRISLLGLECDLIFDTAGTPGGVWTGVVYRPSELVFNNEYGRKKVLLLTWANGVPERSINFGMRR